MFQTSPTMRLPAICCGTPETAGCTCLIGSGYAPDHIHGSYYYLPTISIGIIAHGVTAVKHFCLTDVWRKRKISTYNNYFRNHENDAPNERASSDKSENHCNYRDPSSGTNSPRGPLGAFVPVYEFFFCAASVPASMQSFRDLCISNAWYMNKCTMFTSSQPMP